MAGKRWTEKENQVIKDYYFCEGPIGCYKRLSNRTIYSIKGKAFNLKIKGNTEEWKKWEIEILNDFYFIEGSKGCHERLPHRSRKSIQHQTSKFGIQGNKGLNLKNLIGNFYGDWEVLERGKDYITPKGSVMFNGYVDVLSVEQ